MGRFFHEKKWRIRGFEQKSILIEYQILMFYNIAKNAFGFTNILLFFTIFKDSKILLSEKARDFK